MYGPTMASTVMITSVVSSSQKKYSSTGRFLIFFPFVPLPHSSQNPSEIEGNKPSDGYLIVHGQIPNAQGPKKM